MRKQFDLTRMMEIFRQIIEKIELSCDETLIKKTLDGKCLVCLLRVSVGSFSVGWEAEDHLRSLELCGLTTKRRGSKPTW